MKDKIFAACTGIVCCYCAKEYNNNAWCQSCMVNFLRKKTIYRQERKEEELKLTKNSVYGRCVSK